MSVFTTLLDSTAQFTFEPQVAMGQFNIAGFDLSKDWSISATVTSPGLLPSRQTIWSINDPAFANSLIVLNRGLQGTDPNINLWVLGTDGKAEGVLNSAINITNGQPITVVVTKSGNQYTLIIGQDPSPPSLEYTPAVQTATAPQMIIGARKNSAFQVLIDQFTGVITSPKVYNMAINPFAP